MKNFAWINTETEYVENVIWYDGETEITLPPNTILIELPEGLMGTWIAPGIGWSYIDGQFVEPEQPERPLANNQSTTTGSQTL